VIALRAGQPEGPLLQDRVAPVPEREAQAQPLLNVAEPGQPVLTPPVGVGPRLVVGYVVPCVTAGAVVLAYRPPLPLTDVRAPCVPLAGLAQPVLKPAESRDPFTLRPHRSPALRLAQTCGELTRLAQSQREPDDAPAHRPGRGISRGLGRGLPG